MSQKSAGRQAVHQAFRLAALEGCGGEDDILQGLRQHAPEPQQNTGAKLGIRHHAGDQFPLSLDHLGDQEIRAAILGTRPPQQLPGRGLDRGRIPE